MFLKENWRNEMASQGDKITYFLVGGFVGAAIALLFAPRTGQETRRLIETKYREGSDQLSQTARDGKQYLEEKGEWVAEKARESKEKLSDKSRQVVEAVGDGIEKGKDVIAKKKKTISKAVEAGKKAYEEGKERLAKEVAEEEA